MEKNIKEIHQQMGTTSRTILSIIKSELKNVNANEDTILKLNIQTENEYNYLPQVIYVSLHELVSHNHFQKEDKVKIFDKEYSKMFEIPCHTKYPFEIDTDKANALPTATKKFISFDMADNINAGVKILQNTYEDDLENVL